MLAVDKENTRALPTSVQMSTAAANMEGPKRVLAPVESNSQDKASTSDDGKPRYE